MRQNRYGLRAVYVLNSILYVTCSLSPAAFKSFSLSLLRNLIIMWLGVASFIFILLRVCWASWIFHFFIHFVHFSSHSFKVHVWQFLPFHHLSLFLLIGFLVFFFLGISHSFLWMTDNFLSDPQHCEFYFLKCSACCVPLKSAGLCSACSYLHVSLILSRSAFFFSPKI